MLPSTGYFKSINCPFYDVGTCDRPYCHFKHLRREDVTNPVPSIVGYSTSSPKQQKDEATIETIEKTRTTTTIITNDTSDVSVGPNSEMIQRLVSDAVSKALADQGVTDTENVSKNIVSKVVEGLKPKLVPTIGKHSGVPQSITKPPCVYNPTPISELKKRHIAVPVYNPTRDSRVAVKRKSTDDTIKPWLSVLPESIKTDQRGSNEITYKPTAIVHDKDTGQTLNYIPTLKSDDSNSSDYTKRKDAYYPKSKKRREEYVPKKIKAPLQSLQQMDDVTLDSFDPEINLLNDIIVNESENPKNSDSNSQDVYNLEGRFSDDEVMAVSVEPEKIGEVQKDLERGEKEKLGDKSKIEEKSREERRKSEESRKSRDDDTRRCSISSESSKHSENTKNAAKQTSNSESSKDKKHSSSKSSRSDKDRNSKNSHSKKDSRHHKSSSNSSEKHRSSSSKHSDAKSHREKNHSSHSSSKDKSHHSSSNRDKSSSKENNHQKSSKHEKHKSSTSNKKSSSRSSHKSESSSNHRSKESKKKTTDKKELISEKNESDNDSLDRIFDNSFEEFLETSDSEHDVEEECLKIFQEYEVTEHPKGVTSKQAPKQEEEETEEVGKKRVAHPSAANSVARHVGPVHPPKRLPNPQQRMYDRWRLMKEAAAEKAAEKATKQPVLENESNNHQIEPKSENIPSSKSAPTDNHINGNSRVRIAHVPYAMSLAISKKKVVDATSKPAELKTIAQTTAKGTSRVAHIPQAVPTLVRPEPLQVLTQKFPINVRQYYVNLMHDICIQIYTNGDDAAQRALREEQICHERCKALSVYKNSCMLAAHRLRKEVDQGGSGGGGSADGSGPSASGMVSHTAVLAGKNKGSWSVVKVKKAQTDFKGSALYSMLKKWIMTEEQLRNNGFPRTHPDGPKGRAKFYATRGQPLLSKVPNERYCVRCGQAYMVDKHGNAVQAQNCIYHWGRKFTIRGEGKYSCCQQYGSAGGCCDAKAHVWDYVNYDNLRGYVQTLPKDLTPEEQGVYALDCEMCYTTQGLELTRVTVINDDCNVIYETLVKPDNPIIDYNTRFSGITEENMNGVTTNLLDVQATLLTMFSEFTILVGHSLESDFKALKLIHNTVVDTSMMFPHKHGLPHKRALKNLCSEYLRKIIQNDVGGHDSNEDAVSCMELIHWKVKEEAKLQ